MGEVALIVEDLDLFQSWIAGGIVKFERLLENHRKFDLYLRLKERALQVAEES